MSSSIIPDPKRDRRMIYAYTTPDFSERPWKNGKGFGWVKIGQTSRDVRVRIREQFTAAHPNKDYAVLFEESAQADDKSLISDRHVHRLLERNGILNVAGEWFEVDPGDITPIKRALLTLKEDPKATTGCRQTFGLRDEQRAAIDKAMAFYERSSSSGVVNPRFLWNAKMRFGKSFTAYHLAQQIGAKLILVLTFQPASEDGWESDLKTHEDFRDWDYIGNGDSVSDLVGNRTHPVVKFQSFQGLSGTGPTYQERLSSIRDIDWDLVIVDEYHFGAHREAYRETVDAISRGGRALLLSGTPFRVMARGEFHDDAVYSWTYLDEKRAKEQVSLESTAPYEEMPNIKFISHRIPSLDHGENQSIKPSEFFNAKNHVGFDDPDRVNDWLGKISSDQRRGERLGNQVPLPYQGGPWIDHLRHTLWIMEDRAACDAMAKALKKHRFFRQYHVENVSGFDAASQSSRKTLQKVKQAIRGNDRGTITLSVAKLIMGVTVPEWTAVLMLSTVSSPETYFQAAFRAQSAGTVKIDGQTFIKNDCYVFDFDPFQMLGLGLEYRSTLSVTSKGLGSDSIVPGVTFIYDDVQDGHVDLNLDRAYAYFDSRASGDTAFKDISERAVRIPTSIEKVREGLSGDLFSKVLRIGGNGLQLRKSGTAIAKGEDGSLIDGQDQSDEQCQNPTMSKGDEDHIMKAFKKGIKRAVQRIYCAAYVHDLREGSLEDMFDRLDDLYFEHFVDHSKSEISALLSAGYISRNEVDSAIRRVRAAESHHLTYLFDRDQENADFFLTRSSRDLEQAAFETST